jgi:hypothetical protein
MIVFHGERDPTVQPRNADQIIAQSMAGGGASEVTNVTNVNNATHVTHVTNVINFTNFTNVINVTKGRVASGHAYTRTVHQNGDGNVVAEQ